MADFVVHFLRRGGCVSDLFAQNLSVAFSHAMSCNSGSFGTEMKYLTNALISFAALIAGQKRRQTFEQRLLIRFDVFILQLF